MSSRWIERVLWGAAVAGIMTGIVGLRRPVAVTHDVTRATIAIPAVVRPDSDALEEALGVIFEANVFRPDRKAVDVTEVVPTPQPGAPQPPPKPPKPTLLLRGLLGGPPWDALVDGVPGHEGAMVLRAGQTTAGLTLKAIRHDTVFIKGLDTTWKLILRRGW
ncbi:MAG: hypothetical protein ACJ8AD_04095 [Gemmatimonadaceae bacterium]